MPQFLPSVTKLGSLCVYAGWLIGAQLQAQYLPAAFHQPGREGARALLAHILETTPSEIILLTDSLRPLRSEYELVFNDPGIARKVWRYHRKLRRQANIYIRPLRSYQTDILLFEATTEELRSFSGEAQYFQGGYREIAPFFRPGLTFYRFKFVEPGRRLGTSFDVLVFIKGRWRIFHRPWEVVVK